MASQIINHEGPIESYISKRFYFPETNREEILKALKNLQVAYSNSKKPSKKISGLVSTSEFNDLWKELKESKEKCRMLEDELNTIKQNGSMKTSQSDDKINEAALNDIKEAIAQNCESQNLKNWKKVKHCDKQRMSPHPSSATFVSQATPAKHFKINAEIPFITGKSTGKSHSVSANFQEVLSLLKAHNLKLCRTSTPCSKCKKILTCGSSTSILSHDPPYTCGDSLNELKSQLRDEYQQLKAKHLQMSTLVKCRHDSNELKEHIKRLQQQMDLKSDQIDKISQFLDLEVLGDTTTLPQRAGRGNSKLGIKKLTQHHKTPKHTSNKQQCLELLKSLKEIQSSLR